MANIIGLTLVESFFLYKKVLDDLKNLHELLQLPLGRCLQI